MTSDTSLPTKDDLDLGRILRALWRGKLLLLAVAAAFTALGIYYALFQTENEYVATAIVEVAQEENSIVDLNSLMTGTSTDKASLNTQLEVLRSREVAQLVVRRLDLNELPEFNPLLRAPPRLSLAPLIALISPTPDTPERTAEQTEALGVRLATETLQKQTEISLGRDTYLFEITIRSSSPNLSQRLANTLADVYIEQDREKRFAAAQQSIDWLTERVQELEVSVREAETALREREAESDFVASEGLLALNVQAKEFRERLNQRGTDIEQLEARIAQLDVLRDLRERSAILDSVQDAALRRAAQQLDETVNPGSTAYAQFLDRLVELQSREQVSLDRARIEYDSIADAFEQLQSRAEQMSQDQQELEQMRREIAVTQDLYQTFLTGLQEATVQTGLVQTNTRLMSEALAPRRPDAPNRPRIVIMAAMMGLVLAAIYLVIQELSAVGIRSKPELEASTGRAVMGEIPRFPLRKREELIGYLASRPTSAVAEAVRNLRTSVFMASGGHPPQLIMITSSVPGEGKTTLSISMALNLSGMGKRVLLIEGDIRRRTLDNYFEKASSGMLDVIHGHVALEDAIFHDNRINIDVLMGQKSEENPADLFSSQRFDAFIAYARQQYDHIIIDSPPVLVVPDSRILARVADTILYAVRWDATASMQVIEGLKMFNGQSTQPLLVMTQIDTDRLRSYYGGAYGYSAYSAYGQGYYDR